MGERGWKPGDVAMVTIFGEEHIAIRSGGGWVNGFGSTECEPRLGAVTSVRRLVVIDPEDREQVERLADIFCARPSSGWVEQMRDALREFANPKPPQCGAVLNLAGAHHRCEGEVGHDDPHHNRTAEAIWGERP